jgi:tRNA A-37 threonylcarbamoyl transferase component Bud32
VEADWFSDPERIHIEAKALRWLPQMAPAGSIPAFLFEDFSNHVLAMQAVPEGHQSWKTLLLNGEIVPAHFAFFGELIGMIHRNSFERSGELRQVFDDRSFFESLRLEPYYLYSAGQAPEAAPFLHNLIEETRQCRETLVHGDYSPKNIHLYDGALILLDCEVVHFGDPAFDLGFSLTHFLSKANRFAGNRQKFLSGANMYWQAYQRTIHGSSMDAALRPGLESRVVRQTLGCLLARVVGRSPLEYLGPEDRIMQRKLACSMMPGPPATVEELVSKFGAGLES